MSKQYFELKMEVVTFSCDVVTTSEPFGPGHYDNTADDVYDFND